MAYIIAADFRLATLADWCIGLDETTADVSDANLTTLIATASALFDKYTGDHFEPEAGLTLVVDGEASPHLWMPKRIRAVTSVSVTYYGGSTPVVVPSTSYTFEAFTGDFSMLEHESRISLWPGLYIGWPGGWPKGRSNITVVGDFSWPSTPGEVKRAVALACWERVTIDGSSAIASPATAGCFSRLVEAQSFADLFRRKGRA